MPTNQQLVKKLIEKSNLVSEKDLKLAQITAKHLGCSLEDVLLGRGQIEEQTLRKILADHFEVREINLKEYKISSKIISLIPENLAVDRNLVIFDKKENQVSLAMEDPKDMEALEMVRKVIGSQYKIFTYYALPKEINDAHRFYQQKELDLKEEGTEIVKSKSQSAVTTIENILEEAMRDDASDIHIEPFPKEVLVRHRIDGVLHDRMVLPVDMHAPLVARTKVLSDLKLDEHRLPQDGRFAFKSKSGDKISLRVSIIPTVYGEKIVLRLLEDTITRFNLEDLGLLPEDQQRFSKIMDRSHGMFLITGPTGSGKTTTLYTLVGLMNHPGVNIITIEDPVENRIRRINQIQINPQINLTFANGLRSILRQDPDIIMVGEIRDNETAVIAVNAAMTGHLVYSSVHANNAASAIPRMLDLGVEPFLLASTLNMVAAQRLVRILCPKCKEEIPIAPGLKQRFSELEEYITPDILKLVTQNYFAKGCAECSQTGFRKRTGIYELINVDDQIKDLIVDRASSVKIRQAARAKSGKTMLEDGLIKVSRGITTIEEVFRVISE